MLQSFQATGCLGYRSAERVKGSIGKLLFPKFFPQSLGWIQFGRIWGKAQQFHVLWNMQKRSMMRWSAVQHHHDEFVRMSKRYVAKKRTHGQGVHLCSQHPIQAPIAWCHGRVCISVFSHQSYRDSRPHRCWSPASPRVTHPSKSCFILENNTNREL